ncbi:metal ABC transporter permease [Alkalicoccus urumqiensis]|uniref:Metal ABC transporter permease n=1 Tax=Alkalicoccus urumqiensis TaxID=1548213 RepID=A0A2P6MFR0_ALKUR|nr:metal ABC transporter permease [Alkalicoccus urumqiensis]PRO65132.1 metal ABC transporter permease [Alkalicoccus urumqiensis]
MSAFWTYEFLRYSLFTSMMIGVLAPVMGVFVVVRRMSLMADALSHITLTGIAFSLLIGRWHPPAAAWNPVYMGMVFAVGGSVLIDRLRRIFMHYKEAAITIILSGAIGVGVVFISLADGFNTDLFSYLFGSVSAVSRTDFFIILILSSVVLLLLVLFYKELFFLSFDEEQAVASGIPRQRIHALFIVMTALVIGLSMQIVGILLVSALMTLPVAAAMRFAGSFKQLFIYAAVIGEVCVLTGLFAAFYLDTAPGGTIVLLNTLVLVLSIAVSKAAGKEAV